MRDGYRSATAGLRERISALRTDVERATRDAPEIVLALLPDELHAETERALADDALADADASIEALTALDAALSRVAAELAAAVARADDELRVEREPRDPPPSRDTRPYLLEEPLQARARAAVELAVFAHDRFAEMKRWGDAQYVMRFAPDAIACILHVHLRDLAVAGGSGLARAVARLSTSIPPVLPDVRLRPETTTLRALRALRFVREAEVGDADLDAGYLLEAPPRLAACMTRAARAPLIALRSLDAEIRTRRGALEIDWSAPLDRSSFPGLDDAVAAALAIRRAVTVPGAAA